MDNENVVASGGGDYSKVKKELSEPDYEDRPIRYYCPECGDRVTKWGDIVAEGYFAVCTDCDKDFHECELEKE